MIEDGARTGVGGGSYEAPRLTVHGSLKELTHAQVIGTFFDKSIPAGSSVVSIFGSTSL